MGAGVSGGRVELVAGLPVGKVNVVYRLGIQLRDFNPQALARAPILHLQRRRLLCYITSIELLAIFKLFLSSLS